MNSIGVAGLVLASAIAGAVVGMLLGSKLPKTHLHAESKDAIRLGTGLIATMAALVLGLLVGAAKSSFDTQTAGFRQMATNLLLLDRALARYGPEAQTARERLRQLSETTLAILWPEDGSHHTPLSDAPVSQNVDAFFAAINELKPQTESQKYSQGLALQTATELGRLRWSLSQQGEETLPRPFLAVLAFWLFVLFLSFGLFAPRNGTVFIALFVSALSVAGATLLIVDLDQPYEGLLRVSDAPLRNAVAKLGQ